jgi:hypothetical protein
MHEGVLRPHDVICHHIVISIFPERVPEAGERTNRKPRIRQAARIGLLRIARRRSVSFSLEKLLNRAANPQ